MPGTLDPCSDPSDASPTGTRRQARRAWLKRWAQAGWIPEWEPPYEGVWVSIGGREPVKRWAMVRVEHPPKASS